MNAQPANSPPTGPVDAVNRRFMRLLGKDGGPLMWIWGVIASFNLGIAVLGAAIQMKTDAPLLHELFLNPEVMNQYGPDRPIEANFAGLLLYPLLLIMMTLYYGSFRALRAVEANPGSVNFADARKMMFERFLPTGVATLAFLFLSGLGSMCCLIPGIVAMFFLYFAPYLVASHDMSPGRAFSESIALSKRHGLLVALLVAIALVITFGTMVIQFFTMATFHGMLGSSGIMVASVVTWAMASVVGYLAWLYTGSVFVTVSRAESDLR